MTHTPERPKWRSYFVDAVIIQEVGFAQQRRVWASDFKRENTVEMVPLEDVKASLRALKEADEYEIVDARPT